MLQVFEDGLDPDSLFDRLKEDTLSTEKKIVTKIPKPRKVRSYINSVFLMLCIFGYPFSF